ncbi:MAG: Type 1 glutamine amidotransferase-like domain-containing protein [Alphaproteobacteria bacterium]|nr:Type 1 glutamine amidotransferase-like domain-containing protein [Alphaproteobacteria bacterium]
MVHALLCSAGFQGTKVETFFKELCRSNNYTRSCIITTAHPKKEKAHWMQHTHAQFNMWGIASCFIDIEKGETIPEVDVVFVGGGNTFTLMKYVSQYNIKSNLTRLFERGGLYVGSSAGAIILSPTIESAGEIIPKDKNTIGLVDLKGLAMVPFHIHPHTTENQMESIESFRKTKSDPLVCLKDGEAVYIHNEFKQYIGTVG